MNFDSYINVLGRIPSYDEMRMNALAIRGEQQRQDLLAREAPLKLRQQEQELAEQDALKTDLMALGDSASPEQYWRLAARYPSLKGISSAAQALSEAQRRQVVGSASQIHAALQANRPELARAIVQRSIDADKASGNQPDPDDLALLEMINSGDPDQLRAAKGTAYALVAASNPDTAAKNLNDSMEGERDFTLAPGSRRYNSRGEIIAEAPFAPQYRSVGEGETLVELGGTGGGGQASGMGGGAGSGAPRSVRNNNPGNLKASSFTRSLPGFAGVDSGGFAIFDSPTSGANAQGALLGNYIDRGFNTVGKIINRWAPPSDNNDTGAYVRTVAKALGVRPDEPLGKDRIPALQAIIARVEGGPGSSSGGTGSGVQGGARVVAQGAPKAGYQVLSPAEAQAQGLDPTVRYQRSPEGAITAIGGQNRADSRKAGTDLRKEFDGRAEVKDFRSARSAFSSLRSLATKSNPTGADDVALIFAYSKALDPTSVVRESEFKQAANTSGFVEAAGQRFTRARNGQWLNPMLRQNLLKAAYASYSAKRDSYNAVARQYNGYANELGVDPKMIGADIATPNIRRAGQIKRVRTLQEAKALPPGTIFIDPRGVRRRR